MQPTYQLGYGLRATWAELARRWGLSDQKIKNGTFVRIEKLSFWESSFKFRDIAGTPTKDVDNLLSFG